MAALLDKKLVDKVERLKADANRSLMEKRPIEACGIYAEAIAIQPSAVLHSNRAAALTSLGQYKGAQADAKQAIELDPAFAKAYLRLAAAFSENGQLHEACQTLEKRIGELERVEKEKEKSEKAKSKKSLLSGAFGAGVGHWDFGLVCIFAWEMG